MMESAVKIMVNSFGKTFSVKRRSSSGTDGYGDEVYSWAVKGDVRGILRTVNRELFHALAGEAEVGDVICFVKDDADVLMSDRLVDSQDRVWNVTKVREGQDHKRLWVERCEVA